MKKYEREIRELLDKLDSFVPDTPPQEKERSRDREPEREPRKRPVGVMPPQPIPIRARRSATSRLNQWLVDHHVSMALRYMLAGLGLVILALSIRQLAGPSFIWLAQLIGAIGGIVFLAPVLLRFFRGKDMDGGPQYWRGQAVDTDIFTFSSLRKWIGNRRKGRGRNDPWNDRNRNNRW